MKKTNWLAAVVAGLISAGCASQSTQQARKVKPSGFLGENARLLQPGYQKQGGRDCVNPQTAPELQNDGGTSR